MTPKRRRGPLAKNTRRDRSRKVIPHLLEHLLHLMQFDRPLALSLILTQNMNLAASDLVALDGAFLRVKGAHIGDEGLGDLWR
jgi:hypothetical protein